MNVKEAARELGVSSSLIYKLMANGEIGYVQVGRRRLPLDESVAEFKRRHTVQAAPQPGPVRPPKGRPEFLHLFR